MSRRNLCPVCREPAAETCRCPRLDSTCWAGHHWHRCLPCDRVVMGRSDHARPHDECSCHQRTEGDL